MVNLLLCVFVLFLYKTGHAQCFDTEGRDLKIRDLSNRLTSCNDYKSKEEKEDCLQGEKFFNDKSLSYDNKVSCANCHVKNKHFSDGLARPKPRGKSINGARTISLLDIAYREPPYFWNGRAKTLIGSIYWPLYNKEEMGANPEILNEKGGAEYIAGAIALYLKTLTTGPAPFDKYLKGDCSALSKTTREGFNLFLAYGCNKCHKGSEFDQKELSRVTYAYLPEYLFDDSEARYGQGWQLHGANNKNISFFMKVPSLRNIKLRGGPWGRFGYWERFEDFLLQHSNDTGNPIKNNNEVASIKEFLFEGLKSH